MGGGGEWRIDVWTETLVRVRWGALGISDVIKTSDWCFWERHVIKSLHLVFGLGPPIQTKYCQRLDIDDLAYENRLLLDRSITTV